MLDQNLLQQNLISALNLQALPEDKKIDLLKKMSEILEQRLTLRLLDSLSKEEQEEFEKIIDTTPEQGQDYIQNKFPNLATIVDEEIINFKQELINKFGDNSL